MDYQLRRDLYDRHHAELSSGLEALAHWLNEELQTDQVMITALLQNRQCWEHQLPGREFVLHLNQEEVEVRAMLLDDEHDLVDHAENNVTLSVILKGYD